MFFWGAGLLLLVGGTVYLLRSVFAILFAALVFAYLLDPLVDRLQGRGLQRETGIGLLFAAAALVLTVLLLVVVPLMGQEFRELAGNVAQYVDALKIQLEAWRVQAEGLIGQPIPISGEELLHKIEVALRDQAAAETAESTGLPSLLQDAAPNVGRWAADVLTGALTGGFAFVVGVLNLALLPIFTFYLLRDWDHLVTGIDRMTPPRFRFDVRRLSRAIDERLGAFVRGQTTIAAIMGVLYAVGLLITGIDLAVVVGLTAGLLAIVPYLGTAVGILLASILAVLKFGLGWELLGVWATFAVVQGLEGFVITPRIMGEKVGLHPLVVMLALLVGGNLFGVWGMLLAIPVTAAAEVLVGEWVQRYRGSRFFADEDVQDAS
jgi:predicted PurR-regulated permease PerM